MSLKAPLFSVIPEETIRVVHAAFPKGNRYVRLRDTFGPLFFNPDFQHLFSHTSSRSSSSHASSFSHASSASSSLSSLATAAIGPAAAPLVVERA